MQEHNEYIYPSYDHDMMKSVDLLYPFETDDLKNQHSTDDMITATTKPGVNQKEETSELETRESLRYEEDDYLFS